MGKKNKNKSNKPSEKTYKTPEQEAKRALVNILNFELEVFCLIVDLDVSGDPNGLVRCLKLIREKAGNCSVLLISESMGGADLNEPTLAIAALSANPSELVAQDWVEAAVHATEGFQKKITGDLTEGLTEDPAEDAADTAEEAEEAEDAAEDAAEDTYIQFLVPEVGISVLKEKDKALAAAFNWLKENGLGLDSESDSGENFMASFEFDA